MFRWAFIYGFFRSIYGFVRVHLMFRVKLLAGILYGFFGFHRIQTGENNTKELGFHAGIL